jgi:hypothetical protein
MFKIEHGKTEVCVVKGMLAPIHARSVLMEKKDAKQAGNQAQTAFN